MELDLEDLSFLGDQEEGERADKNLLEARWAAPPYPGAAGRGADADGGERAAAGGAL